MTTKQTVGLVIVIILAAAAGVFFFLRLKKKRDADSLSDAATAATSAADAATYARLLSTFKSEGSPEAVHWMLPYVLEVIKGTRPINEDYLVNGETTKSGAFMAIYSAMYAAYPYDFAGKKKGEPGYEEAHQKCTEDLYSIFYQFQQAQTSAAISAA